jgi:hypothetical protein
MKTLIAIPVYNRLKVSQLCLQSIYRNRESSVVHVYDDHSSEFSGDVLAPFCDELFRLPPRNRPVFKMESNTQGMGVQHLRWYQFRDFLNRPEFDHLYLTDSDALHDPSYMEMLQLLEEMLDKTRQKIPICLYNSRFHCSPSNNMAGNTRLILRKSAPGISHFYTRDMVARIVCRLDALKSDPDYGWDYIAPQLLGLPFLTTANSFVEHFGAVVGSMHTRAGDWNRDRAINPTSYLAKLRGPIIAYLEGRTYTSPSLEPSSQVCPTQPQYASQIQ